MSTPDTHVSIGQWVARAVAVVILIPLRLAWEALTLCARVTGAVGNYVARHLLLPIAEFTWHWVIRPLWIFAKDFLWDWVLRHVLWGLVLTPLWAALLDFFLRPLRRAVEIYLWRKLIQPTWRWLLRWVVLPAGRAAAWLGYHLVHWLIAWPLSLLWRWVLRPLWHAVRSTARYAWRVAAVVVAVLVVIPCQAVYRVVLRPLLLAVAVVWQVLVARPVRRLHVGVIRPMNRWASEIVAAVFGR